MAKPFIVDITQDNKPIAVGERAGDAPKTCGCGGKEHGQCGGNKNRTVQVGESTDKGLQLVILAVIVIGAAICFFYFS